MASAAEIAKISEKIEGFYSLKELQALAAAALHVPEKSHMLEIGTWGGRSASVLLQVAEDTECMVHLVDPLVWMQSGVQEKLDGVFKKFSTARYEFLCMGSKDAYDAIGSLTFSLVHIDGNHSNDYVIQDCELWLPRLESRGFACFHDYGDKGFPDLAGIVDAATEGWETFWYVDKLVIRRKP